MLTLAIRLDTDAPLLVMKDHSWGVAEAYTFEDPFLKGMILEAEFRLEQRSSTADP